MTEPAADSRIEAVRRFNRFYTRRIGVLQEGLLATPWSLTESRLLWELAHRDEVTASELARELGLDPGYLSRLLRGFKEKGLIAGARNRDDARHLQLRITAKGKRAYAPLDTRSRSEVSALLDGLGGPAQSELLQAMAQIERLLGTPATSSRAMPWLLRSHRAGDIGWSIARHGALYAQEYGWDLGFEALVAQIAGRFLERFDPAREACWIAERERANVGCVFLVQARDEATDAPLDGVAQLRLLLVEPSARGLGIGARLVDECERFARAASYRRIMLWTNSVLTVARAIYAKAGYRLLKSEPHHSFGHDLVGETWELVLDGSDARAGAAPAQSS